MKKPTIINWTTDDRLLALLATGIANLDAGGVPVARAYLGAMGKGLSYRALKLREAQFSRETRPRKGSTSAR